jgi:hypothetical protein
LLNSLEFHPEQATILFNLACYECQLGDVESAKRYLQDTFKINPALRMAALEDEDLERLWGSLMAEVG